MGTNQLIWTQYRIHELINKTRPQDISPDDWVFLRNEGIINGCGAKTGPFANFRPPCADFFEADCDWHDHGYKKGGGILRKLKVDYKFFEAMVRDILNSEKHRNYYKIYLLSWSFLYYLAVSILGWPSYNLQWKKEKV